MRCANCGNENIETLSFGHFTTHCAVCGHNTHTATGIDTRKIKITIFVLAIIVALVVCGWILSTTEFRHMRLYRRLY